MAKSRLPECRRRNNSKPGIAAGISINTKAPTTGLNKTFGNTTPQEESRDPYRTNKNAR
jgi:hypothetical protein